MRATSVVRSSVMPSAKYSCCGSLLRLPNGSTTIDKRGAALSKAGGAAADFVYGGDGSTPGAGHSHHAAPPAAISIRAARAGDRGWTKRHAEPEGDAVTPLSSVPPML